MTTFRITFLASLIIFSTSITHAMYRSDGKSLEKLLNTAKESPNPLNQDEITELVLEARLSPNPDSGFEKISEVPRLKYERHHAMNESLLDRALQQLTDREEKQKASLNFLKTFMKIEAAYEQDQKNIDGALERFKPAALTSRISSATFIARPIAIRRAKKTSGD